MTWYKKDILKSSDFWIGMGNLAAWVGIVIYGMSGHLVFYLEFIGISALIIGMNIMDKVKNKYEVKEDGL